MIEAPEKFVVRISNVSEDYITLREFPTAWSSDYLVGGEWKLEAEGSMTMSFGQTHPHVPLLPSGGGKSPMAVPRTIFNIGKKQTEQWARASAVRSDLGMGAYFPSIREYVDFSVVVTVPLKAESEVKKSDPEAKPWVDIDGELGDFLERHKGKDVLVIYTAKWCHSCPVMMRWLESEPFAHHFAV